MTRHLDHTPVLPEPHPEKQAQTSCFPRSPAFLVGTWEEPQTCQPTGGARYLVEGGVCEGLRGGVE